MNSLAILAGTISGRRTLNLRRWGALLALQRSRQRLGLLDDFLLRDVGLSRIDARHEAEQPIWNVPRHWLR